MTGSAVSAVGMCRKVAMVPVTENFPRRWPGPAVHPTFVYSKPGLFGCRLPGSRLDRGPLGVRGLSYVGVSVAVDVSGASNSP